MTDIEEAIFLSRDALVHLISLLSSASLGRWRTSMRPLSEVHWPFAHWVTCIAQWHWTTLQANYVCTQFTRLAWSKDKEELFSLYSQLAHLPSMVSSTDLSAAKPWIHVADDFHCSTTLLAYETALHLQVTLHVTALPRSTPLEGDRSG